MKKPIIKAKQLIKANIVTVTKDNVIGHGNTIAVLSNGNSKGMAYDLINRVYLPIDDNKNIEGIYLRILNVPFKNSEEDVNIELLEPYIQKYRNNHELISELHNSNFIIDDKEMENIAEKKQRKIANNFAMAKQLIKANIVTVTKDNVIGHGNTIAIILDDKKSIAYDLINKVYLPIDDNKNIEGIYLKILNVPFKDSKEIVLIDSLEPYLKKYRNNPKLTSELHNSNFIINSKEINNIAIKRKKMD